ncbi:TVP38/TMEM64 family protein [Vagococcus carniphilus]|uniref:TVP38/TMEM64 family protein n=1 Tax=Vagococcus carniphilus TaxID=218144 RepID=UPI003B591C73
MNTKSNLRKYVGMAALILLVMGLLLIIVLHFSVDIKLFFNPNTSTELLKNQVRSHGFLTACLLFVLTVVLCAIPGLPTSIIGVLTGVVFGPLVGAILNITANVLGNMLSISFLKRFSFKKGQELSEKLKKQILKQKHPDVMLSFCYMIPVIPSFVINYVIGVLKFNRVKQIQIISLGIIPTSILYAFGGNSLFKGDMKTIIILVSLIFVVGTIISLFKKEFIS